MYTFTIKDNGADLDIIITRSMLALAAVAAFVYRGDHYFLSMGATFILFCLAIFIKMILVRSGINKMIVLTVSAFILFIATHSVAFALILVGYGYLIKFLIKKPVVAFTERGVTIKKLLANPAYQWDEFSNIVLKDNLLTLDFKNNTLIQVNIDDQKPAVDETAFNEFCRNFM